MAGCDQNKIAVYTVYIQMECWQNPTLYVESGVQYPLCDEVYTSIQIPRGRYGRATSPGPWPTQIPRDVWLRARSRAPHCCGLSLFRSLSQMPRGAQSLAAEPELQLQVASSQVSDSEGRDSHHIKIDIGCSPTYAELSDSDVLV